MNLTESVSNRYKINEQIKDLDRQIAELTKSKDALEKELEVIDKSLLEGIKEEKALEMSFDDDKLFLNYFTKVTYGYKDEQEVINYLKDNGLSNLIKTTVTTKIALDKKALNKELKKNEELKKALENLTEEKVTEWVTVTDAENHEKMISHITGKDKEEE